MPLRLQLLIILVCVGFIVALFTLTYKRRLEYKLCLFWMFVFFSIGTSTFFMQHLNRLAEMTSFYFSLSLIFFVGFLFIFAVLIYLTAKVSDIFMIVKSLVEEQALTSHDVRSGKDEAAKQYDSPKARPPHRSINDEDLKTSSDNP